MAVTAEATAFWAAPRVDHDAWCETYWASTGQRHRQVIVQALRALPAWTRLYEPGCHVGPNLRLIRQHFPSSLCQGSDVHAAAIEVGKMYFRDDPQVVLWHGDLLDDLNAPFLVKPDVILTCYTLAYVAPDDLPAVLRRLVAEARVALVLAEPMAPDRRAGRALLAYPEWTHDYILALDTVCRDLGRDATVSVLPVHPPVDRLNAVCTLTLEPA
jgi:hypothetical protein